VKPASPAFPERVLLIRLKGIGDVLLSTPLLRALRKSFPKAEIHFLTRGFCAPILAHNPCLDKLWIYPPREASFIEVLKYIWVLRSERFDWVLDLAAEPRSAWLTLLTGAPLRAGFAFRARKWAFNRPVPKNRIRKYQAEVNLDILRYLGVPDDGNQSELYLQSDEAQWAAQAWASLEKNNPLKWKIGLNPTGSWPSKRWPVVYWRKLAEAIHDRMGVKPVLCGSPDDRAVLEEVRRGIEEKVLVKPETNLRQAAAFISKMDLLIGNDGTPQHMAQALGVKSLTLCGPHWGMSWTKPSDIRHRILQFFLDCGPCDLNVCPFPKEEGNAAHVHQECLRRITPELVLDSAREMLEN
jgi:heptosyltransferase III